mgnify:CR=1 FL=1
MTTATQPQIRLSIGHYGANFLHTQMELNGRGITKVGEKSETGNFMYRVTDKALSTIESKYEVYFPVNWD